MITIWIENSIVILIFDQEKKTSNVKDSPCCFVPCTPYRNRQLVFLNFTRNEEWK